MSRRGTSVSDAAESTPDLPEGEVTFRKLPLTVEALAEPVSPGSPSGPSLLYDPVYDTLRAARSADQPALPQGIWQADLKRADWDEVIRLACDVLVGRSKDLQIAAWLAEAALARYGLEGLQEGLQVAVLLLERFWPTLHPELEEDDPSGRLAPFEWLDEKLPTLLRLSPLTEPSVFESRAFNLVDWEEALKRGPDSEGDGEAVSKTRLIAAFNASDPTWRRRCATAAVACVERVNAIVAILDRNCGREAPSLSHLRGVLGRFAAFYGAYGDHETMTRASPKTAPATEDEAPPAVAPGAAGLPPLPVLDVSGREEAYDALERIAEYLTLLEPHSPAPFLVRRAVAWGRMPLPRLLAELMAEHGDLKRVFTMLGIEQECQE